MKFHVLGDSHEDTEVLIAPILVVAFNNSVQKRARSPSNKTERIALKGTASSYIFSCFILFSLACRERKTLTLFKAFLL